MLKQFEPITAVLENTKNAFEERLNALLNVFDVAAKQQVAIDQKRFAASEGRIRAQRQFEKTTGIRSDPRRLGNEFTRQQDKLLGVPGIGRDAEAIEQRIRGLITQRQAARERTRVGTEDQRNQALGDVKNLSSALGRAQQALKNLSVSSLDLEAAQQRLTEAQERQASINKTSNLLTTGTGAQIRGAVRGFAILRAELQAQRSGQSGIDFFSRLSQQQKSDLASAKGLLSQSQQDELQKRTNKFLGFKDSGVTGAAGDLRDTQIRAAEALESVGNLMQSSLNNFVTNSELSFKTFTDNLKIISQENLAAAVEQVRGGKINVDSSIIQKNAADIQLEAANKQLSFANAQGIDIPGLAGGGRLSGRGNTDTVPAMLTPGEFIINTRATENNLGLLEAINSGQRLQGGGTVRNRNQGSIDRFFGRNPDDEPKSTKDINDELKARGVPLAERRRILRQGGRGLAGRRAAAVARGEGIAGRRAQARAEGRGAAINIRDRKLRRRARTRERIRERVANRFGTRPLLDLGTILH